MANDRLFLECRHCGAMQLLMKYYPGGNSYLWEKKVIEDFMSGHVKCSPNVGMNMGKDRCFNLVTESGCSEEQWKKANK